MSNAPINPLDEILDEIELQPEMVVSFLQQNPRFFAENRSLLGSMSIPHESGKSVSLIERQVVTLRDENQKLKQQLNILIGNARDNDQVLEKTKSLILGLLTCRSSPEIAEMLEQSMCNEFGASLCQFWLVGDETQTGTAKSLATSTVNQHLSRLMQPNQPYCGLIKEEEKELLFAAKAGEVGSAAILSLVDDAQNPASTIAILAIANQDKNYYRNNMSTSILSYIGTIVARLVLNAPNRKAE